MKKKPPMMIDTPDEKNQGKEIISREEIIGEAAAGPGVKSVPRESEARIYKRPCLPVNLVDLMNDVVKERKLRYLSVLFLQMLNEYIDGEFKAVEATEEDGLRKPKDFRMPENVINKIQDRANQSHEGNFSGLCQAVIKGWLIHNKYM